MVNKNRYNPRNAALGEANTKLVLASLKAGPRSVADLMIITGLTRPTILKKLDQQKDVVLIDHTKYPKLYYLKGVEYQTVIDEVVEQEKVLTKTQATRKAIVDGTVDTAAFRFFPTASHHDMSVFHDKVMNDEVPSAILDIYRAVDSKDALARLEHTIKTTYDLIQFRKSLKGEFE